MHDDGTTKDDVKVPDGEVGERINKLFRVEEKDTSKSKESFLLPPATKYLTRKTRRHHSHCHG